MQQEAENFIKGLYVVQESNTGRKTDCSKSNMFFFSTVIKFYSPVKICHYLNRLQSGAPNDNFRKNICSEDDLRSRSFETFVVKFLACMPLLGFSNK